MKINKSLTFDNQNSSLSPEVYLVSQGNNAYLLSLQKGKFYALDGMAYLMLSSLLEKGREATLTYITQAYEVTPEQVSTDLNHLLQDLNKKGLLNAKLTYPLLPTPIIKILTTLGKFFPEPNPLVVNLLLLLASISLRCLGWYHTRLLCQQFHSQNQVNPEEDIPSILAKVDHLVREAAATQLFFPVVCRERALVGYHLLHAYYGIRADLVVGYDLYPFQVHAWVEYLGRVITDDPEHCQRFTEVTRYETGI